MTVSTEMLKAVEALEKAASVTFKRARSGSDVSSVGRSESDEVYQEVKNILSGVLDIALPTGVKLVKAPKTTFGAIAKIGDLSGAPIIPAAHAAEIISNMAHGAGIGGHALGVVSNILKFRNALNLADDAGSRHKIVSDMYKQMQGIVEHTVKQYGIEEETVGRRIDTFLSCSKEMIRRTVTNFLEGKEKIIPDLTDCELAVLIGRLNPTGRHEGMYSVEAAEGLSYLSEKGVGGWVFSRFRDLSGAIKSAVSSYDRRDDPKLIERLDKVLQEREKRRDEYILQLPEGEGRQAEIIKKDIHKLLVQQHMQLSTFQRLIRHSGRDLSREDVNKMLAVCALGICTVGIVTSAVLTAGIAPAAMLALLTAVSVVNTSLSAAEYAAARVEITGGGQPTLEDLKDKGFEGIAKNLHGGDYVYESVLSLDPEILNIIHVLTALHVQLQASPPDAHSDLKSQLKILTEELNRLMDSYYSIDFDLTLGSSLYRMTKDLTPRVDELKRQVISRFRISEESLMVKPPELIDVQRRAKDLYREYKLDESRTDLKQEAIELIKPILVTNIDGFKCIYHDAKHFKSFVANPEKILPNHLYIFGIGSSYLFRTFSGSIIHKGYDLKMIDYDILKPLDQLRAKEMIKEKMAVTELEDLMVRDLGRDLRSDLGVPLPARVPVEERVPDEAFSCDTREDDETRTDAGSEGSIFDPEQDLGEPEQPAQGGSTPSGWGFTAAQLARLGAETRSAKASPPVKPVRPQHPPTGLGYLWRTPEKAMPHGEEEDSKPMGFLGKGMDPRTWVAIGKADETKGECKDPGPKREDPKKR